jgi:hypothetical protein
MPKLDDTHLADRLRKRIADLEADKEIAAKDIRAVLTEAQQFAIDAAWAEQQLLRKGKRARTEQEQQALGWRTKRDIRLDVLRQALELAEDNLVDAYKKKQTKAETRRSKIYLDAYFGALKQDKPSSQAANWANNELTRAKLTRLDGVRVNSVSQRDKEIRELEAKLKAEIKKNMTAAELEQREILEKHADSVKQRKKKRN